MPSTLHYDHRNNEGAAVPNRYMVSKVKGAHPGT